MADTPTTVAAPTTTTVLYGIVAVVGITVAAIVGLSFAGAGDATPLVTSIVGLVVPVLGVLLTLLRVEQVHKVVNSAAAEQRRLNEAQAAEIAKLRAALGVEEVLNDELLSRRRPPPDPA